MIMRPMPASASSWSPRLAALLLSAAAAGSVAYWSLHWRLASDAPVAAIAGTVAGADVDTAAVARALGAKPATGTSGPAAVNTPAATDVEAARFLLLGVVADSASRGGALLAVDGKPPKPVQVGAEVVDGWSLSSVEPRRVLLSRKGADLELQLAPLPRPVSNSKKSP